MPLMDGFDHLLARLERLIERYLEAIRAGAQAELLSQLFAEIISLLAQFVQSPIGQNISNNLSDYLTQLLRRFTQDPYLTLRAAEYLRTRVRAIEDVTLELVALGSSSECLDSSRHRGLPSQADIFQDQIVDRLRFLMRLLDATDRECETFHRLLPSSNVVLDGALLGHTISAVHNVTSAQAASTQSPSREVRLPASDELLRIEVQIHLTNKGKARHVAEATRVFGARLGRALQQHRTDIDSAGAYGVYDPVKLRCVADSLLDDTIDPAILTCKQLIALAEAPVGLNHFWDGHPPALQ